MCHIPVLLNEVLYYLAPSSGDNIIDATFGYGGHTSAILNECSDCIVLGIDRDPNVISRANQIKSIYNERFNFIHGRFSEVLSELDCKYNKILFDFGVSSMQLDTPERGFSFSKSGNIDMRMSQEGKSAYDVINSMSQEDLAEIIWKYGDETKSRKIAKAIVEYRTQKLIETTEELRNIIHNTITKKQSNIDVATKTFQAIRIYVNDELNEINKALNSLSNVLVNNSIIVTISFHSLEDRIVKYWAQNNTNIIKINNNIINPSNEEIKNNPRARSAILRAFRYVISD
ncbi:MAG: 16S rRNA (cytosine(1402)-N(4))-methyltransferase RsmH [Alphaproteobacteria bacterium]|nr:16S rRNA (cytosine(1402)-N(4))-methyltransferase RsmH [Alphaproteobacteria bacterium]